MIGVDASERPATAVRPSPLADRFAQFAARDCKSCSPLYEQLGSRIARDPDLLALAGAAQAVQPAPLFFAAVQLLLRQHPGDPLAAFYGSLTETPADARQAWTPFRRFCLDHGEAIRALMAVREVSTNEVGRSAVLRPAFATVARAVGKGPLHLVEIGAAAGLNLLWDRFATFYEPERTVGPDAAALNLTCRLIGSGRPPLDMPGLAIGRRIGIDLKPLDADLALDRQWLDALVWPEHRARRQRLAAALDLVAGSGLQLVAGDGTGPLLGAVLDSLPADEAVCVFHSFALGQPDAVTGARLEAALDAAARTRPVFRVGLEWESASAPVLRWRPYGQGRVGAPSLALADPHGAWLEWLAG